MRIPGKWRRCEDGVVRPTVVIELTDAAGGTRPERFLIDSGADRTVLTAEVLGDLGLPTRPVLGYALTGVGGSQAFVQIDTTLSFRAEGGYLATIQGTFSAFTDPAAADMSYLGRDVTDVLHVFLSRPHNLIYLLTPQHGYRIDQ